MLPRFLSAVARRPILFLLTLMAGCAVVNTPINTGVTGTVGGSQARPDSVAVAADEVYIGLAFSGGGTRATSFGYGMLEELRATGRSSKSPNGMLDHVRLVSGVSGGSVMAAYYGLAGPRGLPGFRDDFLIKNAEVYMNTQAYNPVTIAKGLSGGVNGRDTFARFLDETILGHATFADLARNRRVLTWINAADIANNTPFLFSPETFDALCSDLSKLPVSEAVAASAAFPLVFSPIVLESHQTCNYREPDWLTAARNNPEATSAMRAYGQALDSYRDPDKIRYLKLLDGGVTDNFGTTGLSVARAKAQNAYGPLTRKEAVKMKRILFLVANAGVQKDYEWTQRVKGPGGVQLAMSIANSSLAAATRVGYDVMRLTLDAWQEDLVDFRCSLSDDEVADLRGTLDGWDCTDLKLFVGEVNFSGLDKDQQDRLNEVPTRLRLPEDQVDLVIAAAREATRYNPEFRGFLKSLEVGDPATAPDARQIAPRRIVPSN
jgi:predicted acylesterase/phospholipase RssA